MSELNRNALLAIETLRARVRELEGARREAIAIVGYAARLPGAPDAEAFWSVLEEGRDAVSNIPADRWDADAFYDADPDAAGKMLTRRAGFIDDVAGFDAPFFGISPREAMYMDPQHRILLETAWQALEHASLAPADLAGTRAGVFVGLSTHDYLGLISKNMPYEEIQAYFGTGTSPAAGAGRISYRLGFEGPTVTVDTACSSSLVAIHQASQALRAGECDLALAGGVNVILSPGTMINFSRARMLAPDGRCKTFDASADGYVRGEGCGVVVLKRLSDARRDGDRIRAVIRGSAVNQDGASGGLTVPSGRAQQRVIGDALRQAGLEPADVDYLEAHGTGTSLGDPIEVQAAAAALGPGRSADHPLRLGSVKTNIGHLEAAAGIAGVIKVVLAMEHEALPKHLHFKTPSPHIPWERLPVQVVEETTPWARTDGRRRTAGVSSFGFSGTNAHVLLEEAPAPKETPTVELPERRYHLLPLSARTPEALDVLVARTHAWLEAHPDADIADVAHTAAVGRSPLEHRAALVVDSRQRAGELLAALADERPAPGLFRGTASDSPKTAWLFTGQGSQYPGMGRELFDAEPVFRQTLERCDEVLREHLERPLLEVLFGEETPLGHTSYAQPALFALEMSLARLWEHWGLVPDVLLGHSVGQYAAACVAGVFSLDDGLRLLAERGKLFGALPTGGRMAAVFAEAGNVEEHLDDYPHLSVAAYNGAHTVVSGPGDDVHALVERFQRDGVRCELIDTSHAFHSELIEPALDELETTAQRLTYRPLERTLICNRTGKVLTGQAVLDASYWRRHARQPVRFAESVQTLSQLGCKVLLEIGPQPVLSATALRAWPEGHEPPRAVASLRRDVPDDRQALEALAQLWVAGARVDFRALASERPHRKLDLPTYPFQHQRFWFETAGPRPAAERASSEVIELLEEGRIEELVARLDGTGDREETRRVLERLSDRHQREGIARSTNEHLYEVQWQRTPSPLPRGNSTERQRWLLVVDDARRARPALDLLETGRHTCRVVELSGAGGREERQRELEQMFLHEPPSRILFLASLGVPVETSEASLRAMQQEVLGGALEVLGSAIATGLRAPVWIVTRGAQSVLDTDRVCPAQTCLWGFGQVLGLEHPELRGGLADLSPTGTETEWSLLLSFLDGTSGEDQIALRGDALYVPRLKRKTAPTASLTMSVSADATYWITGGLGALGFSTARYLAEAGGGHLVLTSRRPPGENARNGIAALCEAHGCHVHVVTADVSREEDVRRVLAFIDDDLPPLAGVVHAAGEVGSSPLKALTAAEIESVFGGKVWGAWHLSELLAGRKLDFFVSFSSIASVWGSFGQAAYAAANAFLDGLASRQRSLGISGTSVNFGPWSDGMATAEAREQLAKRGVSALPAEGALAGMSALVGSRAARGVVARVDWNQFLPVYQLQGRRPLMAELELEYPVAAKAAVLEKTPFVQRLLLAPAEQRKAVLQEHVRNAVAETTRLDPSQIKDDAGFFDLGMDSLMAIELRQRLEKDLGRPLPATIAIDYPRLTDAAEFLLGEVLGSREPPRAETAPRSATASEEPIAIIGAACRFPGAEGLESFWELLSKGVDAIREVPSDRFDINDYYDPDPEAPGKIYTRCGGFLDHVDLFDAELFGISPREAVWIDPQQRIVLETAWEGLESAGCAPASLARSRTGVYLGVGANEYSHLLASGSPEGIDAYFVTGNALNVIAGRVAFALGLEGPAMAVDTACSSSLVAIHQASQALRAGDCDLALAGGVNVLLSPATTIATCRARMLAPDGRCKTFDASADGYVRGEGCGVIVLKRLSDAERDGDRIRAVIRGSAVNQDGASGGLTVPSGRAQQRVIGDALRQAGLEPADVDYLEAHGTGTSLGDPIEVQAAAAALGPGRSADHPLRLGSVKTNIGHLEAASGIAGVIKVVLAMEHEALPKHLHFKTPSPHIPWERLPVQVVEETTPWARTDGRRRTAGVSSFGFSGTNAHVLLEEAPAPKETPTVELPERRYHLLPLSARTPEALDVLVARTHAWLEAHPDADIADVAHTAAVGRSPLEHRAALVVDSRQRAGELLAALADERPAPGLFRGTASDSPKTAWLFTGQGSQYPGMGRELFDAEPVFRQTLERCDEVLREHLERPLLEVLFGEETPLGHTSYAQPALFALEMSLARLWEHWGLVPDVLLGHSVGQYAAACVAGVFSLDDGLRLLAERGKLFGALPTGGRMAAVFAEAGNVEERLDDYPHLSVAAYNGAHTVVSGPGDDVHALVERFQRDGVRCELIDTSHAFHSELIEPALDELEITAQKITYLPVARTLLCNRTGKALTGEAVLDAAYWRRHARQPVQFAESVQTLSQLGCKVLLEIGPQPVLSATALRAWPEGHEPPRAVASLRRDVPDDRQALEALAQLWVAGARVDFPALSERPHRKLDLPTYPFQRRRFWPKTDGLRVGDGPSHGLLGARRDLASGDVVYSSRFSVQHLPWLEDHVIYGTVVVPGATYASMALSAAGVPANLGDVFFYEPIIFSDKQSREVQLSLTTPEDGAPGERIFQVHSRPFEDREATWSLNASGTLAAELGEALPLPAAESLEAILEPLSPMRPQQLFEGFADNELKWGPTWCSSLKALWFGDREAVGEIEVGEALAAHLGREPIHPVLLDLCTGVAGASLVAARGETGEEIDLFLPLKYERVTLREQAPRHFFCRVSWRPGSSPESETQTFDLDFLGSDGRGLGGIRGFVVKRAPRQALLRGLGADSGRLSYRLTWRELPLAAPAEGVETRRGTWLLVGLDDSWMSAVQARLETHGQRAMTVGAEAASGSVENPPDAIDSKLSGHWETVLDGMSERGETLLGVVWQVARSSSSSALESSDDVRARLRRDVDGLLGLVHHLARRPPLAGGLWILTERAVAAEPSEKVDPVPSAFWGLGRTLAAEQPASRTTLVDHDASEDALRGLADLLLQGSSEPELALRQRKCLVPRLMPWSRSGQLAMPAAEDYRLEPTERGAIDHLQLAPAEVAPPGPGYVQVQVQAAGLNFRDVLNVLGLYPGDPGPVGGELAGVVTALGAGVDTFRIGQRVFGFSPGAFASRVNVPYLFLAHQPPRLSAVEAATAPAAVLTARLAFDWAKPKRGERVLIHAASGGVGLAAVQLVKNCGATVFATASKPKQKMLRELGVDHVYDSRSTDFAEAILADTGGAGVDVVLNSLTNEGFVEATVRATARGGRFVEIAKRDIWSPQAMAATRPDVAYEILALDEIMQRDPGRIRDLLADLAEALETGEIEPLPRQVYPLTEAKAAFRCMQQARHVGKIVLQMPGGLKPRSDRSYWITGGLGALGLRTAAYLAQMGAGHLVLTGRRAADAETQQTLDALASQFHCEIHVMTVDVSREAEVREALDRIRRELPPLAGIVHLAGVLDDALIPQQSWPRFETVFAPKALGAWNLHRATESEELDFFLLYSSASSVLGSPGQANYAAANALLDGLAAHRQARGLPATSVNWGPWAEAGMAASEAARANLGKQGLIPLKPAEALAALSEIVSHGAVQATVIRANWQRMAKLFGPTRPPVLEHVLPKAGAASRGDGAFLRQLQQTPGPQRGKFLTEHLQRELQLILGLAQPPAPESRFLELGMDSLMAVELRNRLLGQFGKDFTISSTVVFDYPTLRELAEYLANQTPETLTASSPGPPVASLPAASMKGLRASVDELVGKLEPFRDLGVELSVGGAHASGNDPDGALRQALLRNEADLLCQEVLRDAVLSEELQPVLPPEAPPARQHALLTGATGYLGGFLLRELLSAGTSVTAVVRCDSAASGAARIVSHLEAMGLWEPNLAELLRVVPGDVTRPRLGLTSDEHAALSEGVDSLFHCAASARWWAPYGEMRETNVDGTRHVVELLSRGKPKVLHLVSTNGIFLAAPYWERSFVPESEFPDSPFGNVYGYGQSMWAAESIARQAGARGARVQIYRCGAVLGAAGNGFWAPRNLATRFMAHSLTTETVSEAGGLLGGVPVDVVVRFIEASSKKPIGGETFHVTHPRPTTLESWVEALARRGVRARSVPADAWMEHWMKHLDGDGIPPLADLRGTGVPISLIECFPKLPTLDSRQFHRRLDELGIVCPVLETLLDGGWLDALRPKQEAAHGGDRGR